ncbi:hypothetical protein [Sinorhizobium sp. BG8]|uniref:hypothetical protein n=1 Tax=Sinorhizobium sp. BG8 TaxID=2613773 RepID=UPI00193D6EEA|nr:hypothetical protein [Sinorhizobium sp. BG8]QRM53870.1 hypothetical protein F3Y30_04345 [Sinorhizobium sp. BG8]
MLTPVQSGLSAVISNTMQSIVGDLEERRREEAEKQSGRKTDDIQLAQLRSDETTQQANARINEHFFGSNARNEDKLAKLISRFSDALGVSQRADETSYAFAQRLSDMLELVQSVAPSDGTEDAAITLDLLGTTVESVKTAMGGVTTDDTAANLVARLAFASGIVQREDEADADFGQRLASMLTRLRDELPADKDMLENQTGLSELGIGAEDLIAAIRNPNGQEALELKDALAEKARAEKALTPEMQKVIDRLEDAADPKSLEELKLERTRRDPTRIEDTETHAEREAKITVLEAGEKLDDVRELQEAVKLANKAAATNEVAGDAQGSPDDPLATIQLLAASVTAAKQIEKIATETGETVAAGDDAPATTTEEALRDLDETSAQEKEKREEAEKDIFVLRVDDNGIYDLFTRQMMAW